MILTERKQLLIVSILGYHENFGMGFDDFWEDTQYYKSFHCRPTSSDFIQIALKIGANMPLQDFEQELLRELAGAWIDNYSNNSDEWSEEDIQGLFGDVDIPSEEEINNLILEVCQTA